ncbi:glycosyltransferase family 2 protein [Candidatus Saccharibacteria bacterium]|nr:glycosyltransferase family 2 protein [Candidatus Saccharibacteria bacterium]
MKDDKKVKVSIICLVYNHEKYLRECLDGFVKQKVNFRFEALVHDDASTDDSKKIIEEYARKYPDIIKPIYEKENIYQRVPYMFPVVAKFGAGKYVAICEGDDFWTDSTKLQRQYDYMEEHPDCALCFHDAEYLDMVTGKKTMHTNIFGEKTSIDGKYDAGTILACEYITGDAIPTASLFFRMEDIIDLPQFYFEAPCEDFPLKLILASRGYAYYMPRVMSVYRRNVIGSATYRWARQNTKKEIARYESIIKTLDRFNEYSNNRYANELEMHKKRRQNTILILKGQAEKILRDRDRMEVYKATDGRRDFLQLTLRLRAYMPRVYNLLRSIKHAIK